MKRILLIRHGEVEERFQGRFIGSIDAPLSETGRAQCAALREKVAELAPELFFCSPLRRATETLNIVKIPERRSIVDPRLREIHFGRWEGLLFDEIARVSTPEELQIWTEEPERMVFPEGEAFAAFAARVDDFVCELVQSPEESIAVVTHGGVLMRVISRWRGLPPCRQYEVLPPRGSLTVFECDHGIWKHVP